MNSFSLRPLQRSILAHKRHAAGTQQALTGTRC